MGIAIVCTNNSLSHTIHFPIPLVVQARMSHQIPTLKPIILGHGWSRSVTGRVLLILYSGVYFGHARSRVGHGLWPQKSHRIPPCENQSYEKYLSMFFSFWSHTLCHAVHINQPLPGFQLHLSIQSTWKARCLLQNQTGWQRSAGYTPRSHPGSKTRSEIEMFHNNEATP